MRAYEALQATLRDQPRRWLVTGGAGFIGANITHALLSLNQRVTVLDNLSTGRRENLTYVQQQVGDKLSKNLTFIEGDVRTLGDCKNCCKDVQYVLHQAALGSVPRSIQDPLASHDNNVNGTLNVFVAARDAGAARVVYASSSSIYGDDPTLPKREGGVGQPLSPYALTKSINEQYARIFTRTYGLSCVGLRYFNVFGPMQRPDGPYAAVIPRWISALLSDAPIEVHGDGTQSRDFCYVANAVQANLLAATAPLPPDLSPAAFNVAFGQRTSLLALLSMLRDRLPPSRSEVTHAPPRLGDVAHSLADIAHAQAHLGYAPSHDLGAGLDAAMPWYTHSPA